MSELPESVRKFIAGLRLATAQVQPLRGAASAKRYWRLSTEGRTFIVLHCERKILHQMMHVSAIFRENGVPIPESYESDLELQCALMEDLGSRLLADEVAGKKISKKHAPLFRAGLDIVARIQNISVQDSSLPRMTFDGYVLELDTVCDWLLPDLLGERTPMRVVVEFVETLRTLQPFGNLLVPSVVHRDFYTGNIMLRSGGKQAELVVIDFEDSAIGSPTYDVVAWLQDLRLDVDAEFERALKRRYVRMRGFDADAFELEYATYGALRALRVLGLWRRLKVRDGKPRYLEYERHTIQKVEANLAHPALVKVRQFFERHLAPLVRK